uniref:Putative sodium-neurotransmitter symporter n=1 Tax=Ixodes ricinus TaxID=34613 RepID=V5HC07_IXORI
MQAQFSGRGVLGIYDAFPISRGLGYVILLMLLFRVVLTCPTMAFVIATFLDCFQEPPPWSKCSALFGKDNSPACYDMRGEQEGCDVSYTQMAEDFEMRNLSDGIPVVYRGQVSLVPKEEFENVTSGCSKGSLFVSYGYFKTKLVQPTDCFRYDLMLCSAAGFVIMFTVLFNGLVGFGKVMYVVLIAPKVLLMLILIHGSSLHGPSEEVIAFPPLRWSNLWDLNIWISAVAQCFMSLPVGGTRYAMLARYSPYENDIEWDAQIICAVNVLLNTFYVDGAAVFQETL